MSVVRTPRRSRLAVICAAAAIGVAPTTSSAQAESPPTPPAVEVMPVLLDATRIESWSFFQPRPGGGDPTYALVGNRGTLGVVTRSRRFEFYGAFQYAQLLGLPHRAVGPGPLGPGALYYDAARAPNAYQLYFKALSLRLRDVGGGVSIEAGRMAFTSGGEAFASSAVLEALKRERLYGRLVGEVEWSAFERGYDGLRLDVSRPRWQATAALLVPVQGAFEESANAPLQGVRVASAAWTLWTDRTPRPEGGPTHRLEAGEDRLSRRAVTLDASASPPRATELQVFAQQYRDRRSERARPDNDGFDVAPVDVRVETLGTSVVHAAPLRGGQLDVLVWLAAQFGDWYGDPHRALSLFAESGYQWSRATWQPWLRAGLLWASGDRDTGDAEHGTFFPGLPSMRPGLLAGTVAQMNLRDVWGEVRLRPLPRLDVRADVHRLSLAQASDRWYSGTGATTSNGSYFGYTSRGSGGDTSLGTLIQARVSSPVTSRWSLRGSLGVLYGGPVVRTWFTGTRLTVLALESLVAF